MNDLSAIPPEARTLVACARGAFSGTPPETDVTADWPRLFLQARQHGIDTYLYPWLAAHQPHLFSAQADPDSTPAAWRARFLENLSHTLLRQQQTAEMLAALADARIDVIALKGAWLGATVYDDPAQRTMSDIDLLVRPGDRDAAHARMVALGYAAKDDVLHNRFACDQTYRHPQRRDIVELHWDVASDMAGGSPKPDMDAIWQNTAVSALNGIPVRAFTPEDQLAHLVQHMFNHVLAVPLRGYLDLALLVRKHGSRLTPPALEAAGVRWKTGRGIPFAVRLACDLFGLPVPQALAAFAPELDAARRAQALGILFGLPTMHERDGETTLLRFKEASAGGRVRLVLQRIFMPRPFLMMHYPCARHPIGLPLAWILRARDLRRQNRGRIKAMLTAGSEQERLLANAASRTDMVSWLLRK